MGIQDLLQTRTMKAFTCVILAITAVAIKAQSCNLELNPMEDLPMTSGKWLNIFTDMVIDCYGKVSSWQFYSDYAAGVFVDIWRPTGDNYVLVGKNYYETTSTGNVITFDVAEADQISVQPGDVVGIHYPDTTVGKVIPYLRLYYTDDDPTEFGLTLAQVSAYQNQNTQDSDLPIGKEVAIATRTDRKKTPALHVTIDSCPDTFGALTNKHVLGGVAHPSIETLADCEALCNSMAANECTSFDYDNKVNPWKDTRCWIHNVAAADKQILDLNQVDHHTRAAAQSMC